MSHFSYLPFHPPSFLGRWPLILPLKPTLRPSGAGLSVLQIPPLLFCVLLSHSGTQTHERRSPTPILPVVNRPKDPGAPSTSSQHLVQTMLTQPPTLMAPHVPRGPTCFISSPSTSSNKNFAVDLLCRRPVRTQRHALSESLQLSISHPEDTARCVRVGVARLNFRA